MKTATLITRVVLKTILATVDEPPERIYYLGDSECILASKDPSGRIFGEYFGNRLASVGERGEWYFIPGVYNAEDRPTRLSFLLVWDSFVADFGQPIIAYSDKGTNLVSAAREGGDKMSDLPKYNWESIADNNKGKTAWEFHPAGCQFHNCNGTVESFVKKFKRSLEHKYSKRLMFMLELQACFKIIASISISRPFYAR